MSDKKGLIKRIAQSYKDADGLGDVMADAIKATTGIKATKDCGCDKRRQKLNKWVPFHKRK